MKNSVMQISIKFYDRQKNKRTKRMQFLSVNVSIGKSVQGSLAKYM